MKQFDVVVIGGGHAGCEAAHAAARMGCNTALITLRQDDLGVMSCNPAIGGIGKGHLVREIDALDGVMGRVADKAGIQFRLLNRSKGPAVQGPRAQADRNLYRQEMKAVTESTKDLRVIEAEVVDLEVSRGEVSGVVLGDGSIVNAKEVIMTTGTFLRGVIHIGGERLSAGRMGSDASVLLAKRIEDFGLPIGRLKTGTPPRLDSRTIAWESLAMQAGDQDPVLFSFMNKGVSAPQVQCGVAHTNSHTHEIIRRNIHSSAMYSGKIDGVGPRYCPSIEDKVVRFEKKDSHQIFLEPESLSSHVVYPNGISTSLPREIQKDYVSSIKGLESAKIVQYGYAIEYDYVDPRCLDLDFRVRGLKGLRLAGQINGTTGYEEAAAQGLVAGLSAACSVKERVPLSFDRSNSYIGVMIDDLVSKGVTEPYRMFTSRAEFRLSLRADNADQRLTPRGIEIGCVAEERMMAFEEKVNYLDVGRELIMKRLDVGEVTRLGIDVKKDGKRRSIEQLMSLQDVKPDDFFVVEPKLKTLSPSILNQLKREAIYSNYISRQATDVERLKRDEMLKLPDDLDYTKLSGLSSELVNKLIHSKPNTLGRASRIEGMTPSALALLAVHARRSAA